MEPVLEYTYYTPYILYISYIIIYHHFFTAIVG